MDDATLQLILELQREDAEAILHMRKGKAKEGQYSDEELAMQSFLGEVETLQTINRDQRMAQSIADAVQADGPSISETMTDETSAARDHEYALSLDGDAVNPETIARRIPSPNELDDWFLAKLALLYVSNQLQGEGNEGNENTKAESSAAGGRRTSFKPPTRERCEACRESARFEDVARAPCGHQYCRDCLCSLFEASYSDESLFPPRCCQRAFVLDHVRIFLTSEIAGKYEEVRIEYTTSNRVYCSKSACSRFIDPKNIQDGQASCVQCGTLTCQYCKQAEHGGECDEDQDLQAVLATAAENGWQRCFSCHRLVELEIGCNHITCLCGVQFCYVCGQHWKTCGCAQWNENRLLARANQIVDRNQPIPQDREVQVNQAVQNLRENHQCQHRNWQYVRGPNQCEECLYHAPTYIFECQQCRVLACNRCRMNRL